MKSEKTFPAIGPCCHGSMKTSACDSSDDEIDEMLSVLRKGAMDDLIASRHEATATQHQSPVLTSLQYTEAQDARLRRFIMRCFRGKRRKPTEAELDQLLVSVKVQLQNGPRWGVYPLNLAIPVSSAE